MIWKGLTLAFRSVSKGCGVKEYFALDDDSWVSSNPDYFLWLYHIIVVGKRISHKYGETGADMHRAI